jgi:chemotaxis protein methyltransferase CheR
METDEKVYTELFETIRLKYGYDFTEYALSSVSRRVSRFMELKSINAIPELHDLLLTNSEEFEEFVQYLSVTVTEMFRDPLFFQSLRENVIRQLDSYPMIRIWIAGCATGQEVYSVAIMLLEEGLLDRSIIYATDINQQSLDVARKGIYPLSNMKTYVHNYLESGGKQEFSQYYTAHHGGVVFDRKLIDNVVFSAHNLATDGSFNEFQLIICRNVLMYFNPKLQDKAVRLFYNSLCPFGYLGLGNKESMLFSSYRDFFQHIDRKEKIFRKIK